jgi:hypothetical protein
MCEISPWNDRPQMQSRHTIRTPPPPQQQQQKATQIIKRADTTAIVIAGPTTSTFQ